ncbi:MAG TPA: citrate synthase [Kofleriaceae bacterium]|nr:citrate synthase [Kofleriaceae bacterium]
MSNAKPAASTTTSTSKPSASTTASGLDNVIFAETAISDVDGERGRLIIAGADVEQLAAASTFEDAVARVLLAGGAPSERVGRSSDIRTALGQARALAWEAIEQNRLGDALDAPDGMDALRASLAHLRAARTDDSAFDDFADAIAAIGAAPVFVAAWSRKRAGAAPIAPDTTAGHAADYLRMTTGGAHASRAGATSGASLATGGAPGSVDAASVRGLDAYLTTVIDHGMNASTFTARVVTSTASDLISAVVAAVGALKGPLHGGAPGPVLDMLDAIGEPSRAEAWLLAELASGRRIMGMGHRIYRVRDPRAAVLENAVKPLASKRLELARAVEQAAAKILAERKPDRPLAANVEFYTAVLLDAVGLPREQFAPTFGVGRIAGWCAHVLEQRRVGRLVRPSSRYVGPMPG